MVGSVDSGVCDLSCVMIDLSCVMYDLCFVYQLHLRKYNVSQLTNL